MTSESFLVRGAGKTRNFARIVHPDSQARPFVHPAWTPWTHVSADIGCGSACDLPLCRVRSGAMVSGILEAYSCLNPDLVADNHAVEQHSPTMWFSSHHIKSYLSLFPLLDPALLGPRLCHLLGDPHRHRETSGSCGRSLCATADLII
jgi:hypothetical protein